jgi:methylated-DNA-[protein]-cysteine S-methyltransferase
MNIPKEMREEMRKHPAFQQKVWLACAKIPRGETRTYAWIASRIGNPKAARAVGTALAKNPFAPTIPCHRVVRSDGGLGGYSTRGGLSVKIKLLRREGALKSGQKNTIR